MKIGVAIAVMNRTDRVLPCVESWLASPLVDTLTLVDWSSTHEVYQELSLNRLLTQPKIRMINVVGETSFIGIAHSYNLSIKYTDADIIVKADIDIVLKKDEFIVDCLRACRIGFLRGKSGCYAGICAFSKNDFNIVGKYDERLEGWGIDDESLYNRLIRLNRKPFIYDPSAGYVYHMPHDDKLRTANYKTKNMASSKIRNLIISTQKSTFKESEYTILHSHGNYLKMKRIL